MLYPYRRSAIKNRQRWNFGVLYPKEYRGEPNSMTTECLCSGSDKTTVRAEVRFLQLSTQDGEWQDSVERRLALTLSDRREERMISFGTLTGLIEAEILPLREGLSKIRIHIKNERALAVQDGATRDAALFQSMVSTHTILTISNGDFISLLDTPPEYREAAMSCNNTGTWPVLVGKDPERDCILSSPIILYDYPQVAPESPGDLFDGAEIDELLTLRILTLTDEEKAEMRQSDERTREILERAEALKPEDLLRLHGTMRDPRNGLRRGSRVRLHPKPGGDVFDVVLAGKIAIVETVERDFEDRTHVAVVIEEDPGKDLGLMRQPGHRFFFSAEEVELIA
jgi:hypothetical protein